MRMASRIAVIGLALVGFVACGPRVDAAGRQPNIVIIYTDDVGYGDLSCYGATRVKTPHLDALAAAGLRFTDAHATAATCTPSRYSLLTGEYAFRNPRAQILAGDAPALIQPGKETIAATLQRAGYKTAVVGKWHLGLGNGNVDWNKDVKPGPLEIGFDYSYLMPATNDRVPCVYLDGHRVDNLSPDDEPIVVSYHKKVGDLPTGHSHPHLLRYAADGQHSGTIINRISRIGYMDGGESAWWTDETMIDVWVEKSHAFIEANKDRPFFLFFSLHNIHAPLAPHERFVKQSEIGLRGGSIIEMDWAAGQIVAKLDELGLRENTIVIFSSDNGPVVTDGYQDQVPADLKGHRPNGPFRGGKYLPYEGGTRLPLIVSWPGRVKPGVSDALMSQVDLFASLAKAGGATVPPGAAVDSKDMLGALLGDTKQGRTVIIEQAPKVLSIRKGHWKYIPAGKRQGWANNKHSHPDDPTYVEPVSEEAQLYDLSKDPGEVDNVIAKHPKVAAEMKALLEKETR